MKSNPIKAKGIKKNLSKNIFVYCMLAYPLLLFCVFWIGVNTNSILMSFQKININGERLWAGLYNFESFFSQMIDKSSLLSLSILNSLKIFALNFVISMPLYVFFSYLLYKRIRGYTVLKFVFMLPSIISGFVYTLVFKHFAGAPFQQVMVSLGLENFPNLLDDLNYTFGTIIFFMIWTSFATSLIVYPNAMNAIDQHILESAEIDGMSNMFQELWYIILPLIYPTLTTFIIVGVAGIFAVSGPLVAFFMFSAPSRVYTLGYYYTVRVVAAPSNLEYPELAAGGLIITAISGPFTLLVKYLLERFSPVEDAL